MVESGYAELQLARTEPDALRAAPNFRNRKDSSTLVLDQFGRILSCSPAAEHIFGTSQVGMLGCLISEFVKGLFLVGSSPSYSARYLVHLCAGGGWRRFEARGATGQAFPIEVNLARMASISSEREMYLLDVRLVVTAQAI